MKSNPPVTHFPSSKVWRLLQYYVLSRFLFFTSCHLQLLCCWSCVSNVGFVDERCCFILPKILSPWLRPLAAKVTGFNIHLLWRNQTLCSPFKCSVHGMNSCLPSFLRRDSLPQLLSILFCNNFAIKTHFPPTQFSSFMLSTDRHDLDFSIVVRSMKK